MEKLDKSYPGTVRIIIGIIGGLLAGVFFNWAVFNLLLDFGASRPEWLSLLEVVIVYHFCALGFFLAVRKSSRKDSAQI